MKTAIVKLNPVWGSSRQAIVAGKSNKSMTEIALDSSASDCVSAKFLRFAYVDAKSIRDLRKALQTREAELVAAGHLEEE
jgi:hypothetical protein